jgi:hypothetical protein
MQFQPHFASPCEVNSAGANPYFLAVTPMTCASPAGFSLESWASLARAGPDHARAPAAITSNSDIRFLRAPAPFETIGPPSASGSETGDLSFFAAHCGQVVPNSPYLLRRMSLNCAFELQLDGDRVVYFEQPAAWVFQPPLDEGNTELRAAAPMISGEIDLRRHGQFVLAPVKGENSVDLYRRVSRHFEFSANAIWPKNDFAEPCTLEDLFMHLSVAPVVAALSAGGVHRDLTAGCPRCGIKLQVATLQSKSPMHGVQRAPERPVHGALRRIDRKDQGAGGCFWPSLLRQSHERRNRRNHARAQTQKYPRPALEPHSSPFFLRPPLPPKQPSWQ